MNTYCNIYHNNELNIDYMIEFRLEIVRYALANSILGAAKEYKTSRNTIKRWIHRYKCKGKKGLIDKSKRPKNSPNKLNQEDINKITDLVKEKKDKKHLITSVNVQRKLTVNCSYSTINKYVNEASGKKKYRKKVRTNGKSIKFKEKLKPFELCQIDIKYLTDIDSLKPYFLLCNDRSLAKYQFTFRDVATGFAIVAYGDEKSATLTHKFLKDVVIPFLRSIKGLDLKKVRIQTDNGKEFTNKDCKTYLCNPKKTEFTKLIEEVLKDHKTIIPGHCTADSEVESFHWAIERDCLAWEDIIDNKSLLFYVGQYMTWFNNKTRWKTNYTPVSKVEEFFNTKITLPKVVIL